MFLSPVPTLIAACLVTSAAAQTQAPAPAPSFADIASRVLVGTIPCELGAVVDLRADPKAESQFILKLGKDVFQMRPVPTSTGVVRLEDAKSGAVWLQISNKSMLMNQKLGRRLADECMSAEQSAVALALKANPVPGLLDAPAQTAPAQAPAEQPKDAAPVQTRAGPLQFRDGQVQSRDPAVVQGQAPAPMPAASGAVNPVTQ